MAAVARTIVRSTKSTRQTVRPLQPQSQHRSHGFVNIVYEPHPDPINCTVLTPTRDALTDRAHPFHIRVARRAASFEPGKLHWRTTAHPDVCKKAFIRLTAARRLANAFVLKLKEGGYERDGSRVQKDSQPALSGALVIKLRAQSESLTASKDDLCETAGWLLKEVVAMRGKAGPRQASVRNVWADRQEASAAHTHRKTVSRNDEIHSFRHIQR